MVCGRKENGSQDEMDRMLTTLSLQVSDFLFRTLTTYKNSDFRNCAKIINIGQIPIL